MPPALLRPTGASNPHCFDAFLTQRASTAAAQAALRRRTLVRFRDDAASFSHPRGLSPARANP